MKRQDVSRGLSHIRLYFEKSRFDRFRSFHIQPLKSGKNSATMLLKVFSLLFGIVCFTPVVQADVTITYNYDEAASSNGIGRLTSVTDTSGSSRFYYNNMGGVSRTDKVVDGTTYITQTGYDILGRVSSITYPDNSVVNYAYTGSVLDRVYEGSTNYAQYSGYNALGKPATITTGNGIITAYTYSNAANGTCPQQNFRTCTIAIGSFQTLTYGYDNNQIGVGNVTSVANTANGNQTFVYDDLYRLTSATGPYSTLTYAYDQIGNMICNSQISSCSQASPNYTYPPSGAGSALPHAVTTAGTNSYSYDLNGNMLQGAGRTMTYDLQNRPTRIIASGGTTNFVYDGGGRVKKIVGNTTTLYIGKLYECANGSCSKHIFAGGQRVALKPVGSSEIYYYHTDHLGSSSVVTNAAGTKVQDLAYYPYGQTRLNTGTVDVHHKYTSQELDDSTGLYFYNARYYDPVLGRFIQADTIIPNQADPQAFNRYSYVRNNPINLVDPSGHRWGTLDRIMDRGRKAVRNTADAVRENERVQVAVGVGLQVFGGPMGWSGGTALLYQSQAGRNILAGEIVVGTAVATFYCGGCGAVASGALAGELIGGYSAYRAGGNVLSGVVVGGALGAATGYLGGGINTEVGSFGAQVGKGFAAGAIRGAGIGAAGGYAGGQGSAQTMLRGALVGGAAGGVMGAAKPLLLGANVTSNASVQQNLSYGERYYGTDFSQVTVREGGFMTDVMGNQGFTLGNSVSLQTGMTAHEGLMLHELAHVIQYDALGGVAPFLGAYLFESAKCWCYGANPFEVAARQASGWPASP